MEADQNQEVPEAVAESQAVEKELEKPQVDVSDQEKPQVDVSDQEKPPEVDPAEVKATPDKAPEPVKVAENVEVTAAVEKVQEKAPDVEAPAEKLADVEEKPSNEVAEQKTEPEEKPEDSKTPVAQSEAKAAAEDSGKEEAAAKEAEKAGASEAEPAEKAAAPKEESAEKVSASKAESAEKVGASEAEIAKPSEAEEIQAELPKESAQQPKEPELPLFYGWFLLSEVEEKIKCSTMEFLKILDTLEAFKKHLDEFTGEAGKEVDLEQYFQAPGPLHCTSKFCDYGKAEGAKEYAGQQVVKESYGSSAELSVVGLMVTPRTFGGRIALTPEQLQLWPEGADKEGVPEALLPAVESLPVGSRAHVTLGCAPEVDAVQTGLDLLGILAQQQGGQEASAVEELELGTLSYLGQGRWYLTLREAVTCDTTFSSFSEDKRPTEPAKKEGVEKKKKPKCSIL